MKHIIKLLLIILLPLALFSKETSGKPFAAYSQFFSKNTAEYNDTPSPVMFSWIGTGNLTRFTISNTGQNGYFEPPVGWEGYNGLFPFNLSTANGRTGEFPRGSKQYYIFASGLWIGAKVREINGADTTYDERVAATAYYSEMGALSDLYQTNQFIPDDFEGAGDFRYKQKEAVEKADYQLLWNYADTSINAKRRALGYTDLLIDSESGDYLSNEDTYCVWGDYLPEDDASTIFFDAYDTKPLGIRVEQRTYSWNADDFIYLNYRITNMNDFPLHDVYFGYFMDNDIGDAFDDLIGYDEDLNLGYSYDSDLKETGWQTLAGYMGSVFLETPVDSNGQEIGLTGFQTWVNGSAEGDVDNSATDDLKYEQLQKKAFEIFSVPQDVRQLTSSGPYIVMQPGETVEITIAVVAGGSLDELRKNTAQAYERYDLAYIGPEPPPSPNMTLIPGDQRVIINWDAYSESVPDPFSGLMDFEGYRIYRSDDGGITWGSRTDDTERYPKGYEPIAEFDVVDNESGRFVSLAYFSGSSEATISFAGFIPGQEELFREAEYSIEIMPANQIFLYNVTQLKSYPYNINALNEGAGFAIINGNTGTAYDDATYVSNALIAFDGIYVSIKNDTTTENNQTIISAPAVGDVFKVQTFESQQIGGQRGLQYYYDDRGLTNGFSYVYAVTAFDAGNPALDLASLESSLFTNEQQVVPRAAAADRTVDEISNVTRLAEGGDGLVNISRTNPLEMVNADFRIEFLNSDNSRPFADYIRIINTTTDTLIVDSLALTEFFDGQTRQNFASYSFYGLNMLAFGSSDLKIDTTRFGWKRGGWSSYFFEVVENMSPRTGPYDFEIEFTNALSDAVFRGDTITFPSGAVAPWIIRNITNNARHKSYAFPPADPVVLQHNSVLRVLNENSSNINDIAFGLILKALNTVDPITAGDIWQVHTIKPFLNGETYVFSSTALNEKIAQDSYTLEAIKVVPNPYYIRAAWDRDRFNRHVNFTHLPQKCRIRIFTVSGILIKTIEHDEDNGDPVGYHSWPLRNKENLDIASGLYIYHVKDLKSGKTKSGKFAIVL